MKVSTVLDWVRQNKEIQKTISNSIEKAFPIESNKRTLTIENISIEDAIPTNDHPAIKNLKLKRKSYQAALYGKVTLRDKETGAIVDQIDKFKIANIPKMTRWYSMIIDGNEYQTVNQLRLKSGIYTRKKANGDLESRFNLEKGFNFTMTLPPEKGIFYLITRNAKYRVYNILHSLNVSDDTIRLTWGKEIFDKNIKGALNTEQADIIQLYKELTRTREENVDYTTAVNGLQEYLNTTVVSPETTKITLGKSFTKVSAETLLATSKKLLEVMRGNEKVDERESLIFKDLYSVEDLVTQFFDKNKEPLVNKIKFRMDKKDTIREIISSNTYSKPIKDFFTRSDLASTSEQTNPAQILANAQKVTFMGTGGIGSRHAITAEVRDVHPTHISFIDPLATPESHKAGVNLGLTRDIIKEGNNMKTAIRMLNGNREFISVSDFYNMKIAFADQYAIVNKKPIPIGINLKGTYQGKTISIPAREIDAYMFSPSNLFSYVTNLIPFMSHDSGNRVAMASRMIGQAIPIINREAPYVQTLWKGKESFQKIVGNFMNPGPGPDWAGKVTKITDDYVYLKLDKPDDKGRTKVKVGLFNNYPLNQESFIHNTVKVKVGDKVSPNTYLAESNFTKDGVLALGANVNVAYMPWNGLTFEDSAVVSASFAKQFTSEKIIRKNIYINTKLDVFNLLKFKAIFPDVLTQNNTKKLDSNGIIKVGQTIESGEFLAVYLSELDLSDEEKILRQMNRGIAKPYKKIMLEWEDDYPGEILYVNEIGRNIDIHIKVKSPLVVGDKLTGLHGNKAIVSTIVPDDEMPHTKDGERMDMIFSPVTVPGRMNIGQIVEAATGKLIHKTNKKPKLLDNFIDKDQINEVSAELKKNNIPVEEFLFDGKDGRKFENKIFWGRPYIMKLRHVVEHKLKSRNLGTYDINLQPSRGKDSGQTMGNMEVMAMLAHGAKANLWESATIKGQQNDEYWRALQLGLPTPIPKRNFAFEKMMAYLKQAGVNIEKEGDKLTLMPMTDKEVVKISNGPVTDAGTMLVAKNLKSIPGGLFDPEIFGGAGGKKWGHINLAVKIPNPMMENAIIKLLDITKPKFESILNHKETLNGFTGIDAIEEALKKLDTKKEISKLKKELDIAPDQKINTINKKIRYLQALDKFGLTPSDYMIKKIPILPPIYRPIYPLPSGDLMISPINKHYRDVSLINDSVKKIKKEGLPDEDFNIKNKVALYKSVKALQGLIDPINYTQEKYEGAIKTLAGASPKHGFIHDKLFSKKQDMSARSTVGLDPSLGIDEVGLPEDMIKKLFKPFVIRELVGQGFKAVDAAQNVKDWTPIASKALDIAITKRPVLLNRAPTLHKHSIQAFKINRIPGKTIKTNPLINSGFNLDFDGDTMAVHVPIGIEAVNEAWNMLPSKNIFKHGDNAVVHELAQEYQFGLYFLTKPGKITRKTFSSLREAQSAKLHPTDVFTLKGRKTTIGKELINVTLPLSLRVYDKAFSKKVVNEILSKVAKQFPNDFPNVINSFKDLGNRFAHMTSSTISLSDFTGSKAYRDVIIKEYQKKVDKNPGKAIQLWLEATEKVKIAQDKQYAGKNNIYKWLESGGLSGSKAPNVTQILSMPGVVTDVRGRPIAQPILKSWGEGLDIADYWNTMFGVRKGIVDTAVSTSDPGALSKALLGNVWSTIIIEEDCKTLKNLELTIIGNEKDILDRCLAENVIGIGSRNQVIDSIIYNRLKAKKIKTVKVRSPLTCASVHGICQKCYGILPTGQFPELGYNVGIADAQAITERSTQLVLRTKHTGAAFAGGKKEQAIMTGFPRLVQLFEVPSTVPAKAILAPNSGTINQIKSDALGGYNIFIDNKKINVPPGKELLVGTGSKVEKGEKLSAGSFKPQELAELKGHKAAQIQIIDELDSIYQNDFHKRTFETVMRAISNNARITETPKNSTYLRGDVTSIQNIDAINIDRKKNNEDLIKYKPFFKSIQVLPQDKEDWLSRIGTNRIINAIRESAATGAASNIHGHDPIPGFLYGAEFGKKIDPKKGIFY